ncbi:MAG: DUF488 family protein [Aliifodinibius sp.]|nr:DUF488 domain-containing protein [Fodinibius sp.]NIV11592.1 DUF488 family protein [Fodinibius sp.]NIY25206.1 DUF488 family protein [Fodinibius sp.]
MVIKTKRVYDPPSPGDGQRILVDRLWPRGIKKEKLKLSQWIRDVAPSDELRKWFSHQSSKWEEFCDRYYQELENNPNAWKPILDAANAGNVTLLYSAKDEHRNNAVALKKYLGQKTGKD